MSTEQIVQEAATARPGYELATFKEAGLPVYVLTLKVLVLERKELGPIDEAIMKAVNAGLFAPEEIVAFLGLSEKVITPVLAALNSSELIAYSCASGTTQARVTLTLKGRSVLVEAAVTKPQEKTMTVCFDALTRKVLLIQAEQLFKPREMKDHGFYEVPTGLSRRVEVDDIGLKDFDRILERLAPNAKSKSELLAIRRIERRELRYASCVMLYYRSQSDFSDINVAFWKEDGQALEHEVRFREAGGPELVGSRFLLEKQKPESNPIAEMENEPSAEPMEPQQATGTDAPAKTEQASEPEQTAPAGDTLQSILCHDHPPLLRHALLNAKNRLLIISPWINHSVVDRGFVSSLESLLRNGVDVFIGYGIDNGEGRGKDAAQNKPPITPSAKRDLDDLAKRFKNFHFVYVGNTHRKSLVCDDVFAVTTSFNWLSFKGDARYSPRDERGQLVRKKVYVDQQFDDDIHLLTKGYSGPSTVDKNRHHIRRSPDDGHAIQVGQLKP